MVMAAQPAAGVEKKIGDLPEPGRRLPVFEGWPRSADRGQKTGRMKQTRERPPDDGAWKGRKRSEQGNGGSGELDPGKGSRRLENDPSANPMQQRETGKDLSPRARTGNGGREGAHRHKAGEKFPARPQLSLLLQRTRAGW